LIAVRRGSAISLLAVALLLVRCGESIAPAHQRR
jgi:hypothetical protein